MLAAGSVARWPASQAATRTVRRIIGR
jgi:hypothetical protein